MRRMLFKSLVHGPLTEAAPATKVLVRSRTGCDVDPPHEDSGSDALDPGWTRAPAR